MSVHKDERTNTWYFTTRYKDETGKIVQKKKRGYRLQKHARAAEHEFKESMDKTSDKFGFNFIVDNYLSYGKGRKKDMTIYNQTNLINKVIRPYFTGMFINEIKPKDIDNFYKQIFPTYSNASMKNIRRALSAIFNYAVNFYDLPKNIVNIVELPKKVEEKQLKYWTVEQFNLFLSNIDNIVYKTMFEVLFWSGMRKGELLAIRPCDLDTLNRTVTINYSWNGKQVTSVKNTASERVINLPEHVFDDISELVSYQKELFPYLKRTDYLFTVKNPARPMSPANVNKQLKDYTALTDLPIIRVHHLRHSHASVLINNNIPLYTVSRHLGHSDIQTTANIYGHLYPNTEQELADVLDTVYKDIENKSKNNVANVLPMT